MSSGNSMIFWGAQSPFRQMFNHLNPLHTLSIGAFDDEDLTKFAEASNDEGGLSVIPRSGGTFANSNNSVDVRASLDDFGDRREYFTSAFSFDYWVHSGIEALARDLRKVIVLLQPGGRFLVHHSNLLKAESRSDRTNDHARAPIDADQFKAVALGVGFKIVDQKTLDWGGRRALDGLTLIEKPSDARSETGSLTPSEMLRDDLMDDDQVGSSVPRVAVLCMQKNEGAMLSAWIKHYSALFGSRALYVFDNDSSDPLTKSVLATAANVGVTVRAAPGSQSFEQKGQILLDFARHLFKVEGYDFAYFSDADEFLVLNEYGKVAGARGGIFKEFARMKGVGASIFRVGTGWQNIPRTSRVIDDSKGSKKVIVASNIGPEFKLDVGFHYWNWDTGSELETYGRAAETKLGYLHFHNRPYTRYVKLAREKLKLRVPNFKRETLLAYRGPGIHLIDKMLSGPSKYYGSFVPSLSASVDVIDIFLRNGGLPPYMYDTE